MKYWLCKDDAITYCVIDSKLIVFTFSSDCGHFIIIPISGMKPSILMMLNKNSINITAYTVIPTFIEK